MKKVKEPKERRELSSGEFTKLFIKNFILNSIFVGIVVGIIYELVKEILPSTVTTILSFILIFVVIVKVYLSAIKESFYEGKIHKEDIVKIAKNITVVFIVLLLVNIGFAYISYVNSLRHAKVLGLEDIALRNLIINTIVNIVMYIIIIISCRYKFLKECENVENII